ncbi:hypothetical protein DM02DRAFT_641875 [Periconia macrospinosa]|uniref:Uncharacterized protein n=1 Tax=Periconia macrospinosa TaxID=97972 RepID=A0A2V1DU58_9PLEO|nr:hypothetical protein DM02DRAFT_641875 [Periconia macrospinosa]
MTQSTHSYRVEKPRSNHNSPMVMERRKTTTGAKLYASLDDHYRMMMGIADDDEMVDDSFHPATTRPVSWHPTSTHSNYPLQQHEQFQPQNWSRHYSSSSGGNSVSSSDFYSLSARNSTFLEPTQDHVSYMNGSHTPRGHQDSNTCYQPQLGNSSSYSVSTAESMPWYLKEWARKNQEQANPASNGSVDFLQMHYPSTKNDTDDVPEADDAEDSGKELIGMGLYDLPDSATGLGSLVEATGKGLKLEETWQPPEENDDDDEDEDDESSDDCEEELPPPPPPKQEPQHLPVPCDMKPQLANGMAGQSLLFDDEELAAKEWWYHQLKQPTMPVRDTGIGYGWL